MLSNFYCVGFAKGMLQKFKSMQSTDQKSSVSYKNFYLSKLLLIYRFLYTLQFRLLLSAQKLRCFNKVYDIKTMLLGVYPNIGPRTAGVGLKFYRV